MHLLFKWLLAIRPQISWLELSPKTACICLFLHSVESWT